MKMKYTKIIGIIASIALLLIMMMPIPTSRNSFSLLYVLGKGPFLIPTLILFSLGILGGYMIDKKKKIIGGILIAIPIIYINYFIFISKYGFPPLL